MEALTSLVEFVGSRGMSEVVTLGLIERDYELILSQDMI